MEVIDTKINSAEKNMDIDKELLEALEDSPILHFYDWERPSITHGYFIKPEDWLYLDRLKELGIDCARRPTGGGIVFHLWDLAFSFLMPRKNPFFSDNALENYRFVNGLVLNAIEEFISSKDLLNLIEKDHEAKFAFSSKFCMARPTKYDGMLKGKKIIGAAQRKKAMGYLHQGTISICTPDKNLLKDVLKDPKISEQILENTYSLIEKTDQNSLKSSRQRLKEALKKSFSKKLDSLEKLEKV